MDHQHNPPLTVDPDDPTAMVLPVIGDTVRLSDGTQARVTGRLGDVWQVEDAAGTTRYVRLDQIIGYPEDETPTREAWQAEADDITPALTVGADVVWFDVETGKTDPMPGKVFQILADQADAFPIVVRWADGALYRHARNELRVVTL